MFPTYKATKKKKRDQKKKFLGPFHCAVLTTDQRKRLCPWAGLLFGSLGRALGAGGERPEKARPFLLAPTLEENEDHTTGMRRHLCWDSGQSHGGAGTELIVE